jgi:glycosyltransferase involved in cell wall biosynthesis
MKIFLDARYYNRSGIGRYIVGLYRGILANNPGIKIISAGDMPILRDSFFKTQDIIPYNSPIYSLSEQIKGSLLMRKFNDGADAFHIPHYNAPWFLPKNSVVTIHDLTPFNLPDLFDRLRLSVARIALKNVLSRAGRIIAVSESTKRDIGNYYPEIMEKVRVIYHGLSEDFSLLPEDEVKSFKENKGIKDYILYVGNRKPHKNLKRLIEAFSLIKSKYSTLQLIIIGEKFLKIDEVDIGGKKLGLKDVVEIVKVSDKELCEYYCGARLLIYPSLYEGFGFPPLEAMACGCPVVASNVASLPEICGDAAYYVDPNSIESIAEGMDKILIDSNLRQALVQKGLERVRLFSWEKSTREHVKVFEEILLV